MLKVVKYLIEVGRRQAYSEIVNELESLANTLPATRDGRIVRQPIIETIDKLFKKLKEGGEDNGKRSN